MGTPFKIPKKNKPSDSSVIHMTSPLSRLQDDVTLPSPWSREVYNRSKLNGSSCVNGRRQTNAGSPKVHQWRPKRASDKLCQHEEDKHTPVTKKQPGPCVIEKCASSQSEEDEKEREKKTASAVRETHGTNAQTSANPCVADKPNGWSTHSFPLTPAKDRTPAKQARTQKDTPVRPSSFQKTAAVCLSTTRTLRPSLKTYRKSTASCAEPIVLSSGDEDEEEDEARSNVRLKPELHKCQGPEGKSSSPAMMELPFSSLFFGTTRSYADGPLMITEESISIPLKGPKAIGGGVERVSACLVPSELRAYGMWDACGTALPGSSSSLLFLALSDAQTVLLNTELLAVHKHNAVSPAPCVLVHLVGRLDDLQKATLASLMEAMAVRSGHTSLGTPLSRQEGLKRLKSHQNAPHLFNLLGSNVTNQPSHNGTTSGKAPAVASVSHTLHSHTRQPSMPRRLIQYPPPPSKGAITVTAEDLECLRDGDFLNDVIIDFYLKYLQLERADRDVADRAHIFSSFFYKQLTRKANSSEEEAGGTAAYRRHGRVRTWTRNVDIFSKDYLFIPVNQEAHWYLVVICFPGLLQPECVPWKKTQTECSDSSKDSTLKASNLPDCTVLGCQRNMVTRRPCILIMDSLKLSYHNRIYMLLQEYLQVEWEMRRGTPRVFDNDSIKGSHCKVPLQDNSSDCGLYLLQYVESFLQNPIVHFDLPLRLERWFPRQQVRRKRTELRQLVLQLYQTQAGGAEQSR